MDKKRKLLVIFAFVFIIAVLIVFFGGGPSGGFDSFLSKSVFPSVPAFGEMGSFNAMPDLNSLFVWTTNPFRETPEEV